MALPKFGKILILCLLLWLYVDMGAFAVYIIEICQGDSIQTENKYEFLN